MSTKGFNWFARRSNKQKVKIDRKEEKKIKLDPAVFGEDARTDECNVLVLPSKKRKTKVVDEAVTKKKVLTKKQRKNFEKVVERKEKKSKRADLLQRIASVQASDDVIRHLISTTSMQTHSNAHKEISYETKFEDEEDEDEDGGGDGELEGNQVGEGNTLKNKKIANIFGSATGKKFNKLNAKKWKEEEEEEDEEIDTSDISTDQEEEEEDGGGVDNDEKSSAETPNKSQVRLEDDVMHDDDNRVDAPNNNNTNNNNTDNNNTTSNNNTNDDNNNSKQEEGVVHRATVHIPVNRQPKMESERKRLPIYTEEQTIMEHISEHDVSILCGETGSGKTTQVPQFLYEAGYAHNGGIIGVTEPRRVAAVCMADRVAKEMNLSDKEVSYQIRYEGTSGADTKINFMTDGVLLKQVQRDFELSSYSVVVLDEAHERSIYTDILLGFLSRIVKLRRKQGRPLKLIIMSATLRVTDFTHNTRLFPTPPPVIKIDARQYPVSIHFNRTTPSDYVQEAFKKTCQIHRRLPEGGVLVFVTSQQEVHLLCSKLKRAYPKVMNINEGEGLSDNDGESDGLVEKRGGSGGKRKKGSEVKKDCEKDEGDEDEDDADDDDTGNKSRKRKRRRKGVEEEEGCLLNKMPDIKLENYPAFPMDEDDDDDDDDDDDGGDVDDNEHLSEGSSSGGEDGKRDLTPTNKPLHVLPLFSLLPSAKQALVFQAPPKGSRLVVVATNVAETSITIPNIKYVVDTGKVKTKFYDPVTGISSFKVTSISQASANQRSGRAGRTGPGHCYRLYSSAVFTDLQKFSEAEILRRPVEDVVLQLKDIGVDRVVNFPFPTPPPPHAIQAAEKLLWRLGALVPTKASKSKEKLYMLSDLGRTLARFPVSPRYAKMIALSHQRPQLLPYIVAMVAGLSVQEVFVDHHHHHHDGGGDDDDDDSEKKMMMTKMMEKRKKWLKKGEQFLLGDVALLVKAICLFENANNNKNKNKNNNNNNNNSIIGNRGDGGDGDDGVRFCEEYGVRLKAMVEVRKLRRQLTNLLNTFLQLDLPLDPSLPPPNTAQCRLLRQVLVAGMVDRVARRLPESVGVSGEEARKRKGAYEHMSLVDAVFIHPSSLLHHTKHRYIIYQHLEETSKLYMKGITVIEPEWLATFMPSDVIFQQPLLVTDHTTTATSDLPSYDSHSGDVVCMMAAKFGPQFWELPMVKGVLPKSINRSRWFARFLLEGEVCPVLKPFCKLLLTPPATMVKSWAHLQPRTTHLLQALFNRDISDKQALLAVWKNKPNFLLKEFQDWLPASQHATLVALWPPL